MLRKELEFTEERLKKLKNLSHDPNFEEFLTTAEEMIESQVYNDLLARTPEESGEMEEILRETRGAFRFYLRMRDVVYNSIKRLDQLAEEKVDSE